MKFKVLAIAAAVALVAAACSSGTSPSDEGVASLDSGSTPTTAAQDGAITEMTEEEVALAFAQCLRDEGLVVDDPTVDGNGNVRPPRMRDILDATEGVSREEVSAARDACMPLLDGFTFGFEGTDRTERDDQLLEFAACMRDNGYDMPDPNLSSAPGSGSGPFSGALDLEDPAFQEAAAACEGVFGGFGGNPGSGGEG